jgi:hypothetical protein
VTLYPVLKKIVKKLKKKIKLFKYKSLFLQNRPFFLCLFDNSQRYSLLKKELVSKNFKIKFIQNGFFKKLSHYRNIHYYLTGQVFCVIKDELDHEDFLVLKNSLITNSHSILFYLDNRFYSSQKIQFLSNFFKGNKSKLPHLSYFYFLLKLGFILKLEKLNNFS